MAGKRKSIDSKGDATQGSAKKLAKANTESVWQQVKEGAAALGSVDFYTTAIKSVIPTASPFASTKPGASAPSPASNRVLFSTGSLYSTSSISGPPGKATPAKAAPPSAKKGGSKSIPEEKEEKKAQGKSSEPSLHFKEHEWVDFAFLAVVGITLLLTVFFIVTSLVAAARPAPPPPAPPASTFTFSMTSSGKGSPTYSELASSYLTSLFESVGLIAKDSRASTTDFWGKPAIPIISEETTTWASSLADTIYSSFWSKKK